MTCCTELKKAITLPLIIKDNKNMNGNMNRVILGIYVLFLSFSTRTTANAQCASKGSQIHDFVKKGNTLMRTLNNGFCKDNTELIASLKKKYAIKDDENLCFYWNINNKVLQLDSILINGEERGTQKINPTDENDLLPIPNGIFVGKWVNEDIRLVAGQQVPTDEEFNPIINHYETETKFSFKQGKVRKSKTTKYKLIREGIFRKEGGERLRTVLDEWTSKEITASRGSKQKIALKCLYSAFDKQGNPTKAKVELAYPHQLEGISKKEIEMIRQKFAEFSLRTPLLTIYSVDGRYHSSYYNFILILP